jgi:hypothetical protein
MVILRETGTFHMQEFGCSSCVKWMRFSACVSGIRGEYLEQSRMGAICEAGVRDAMKRYLIIEPRVMGYKELQLFIISGTIEYGFGLCKEKFFDNISICRNVSS